MFEGTVSELWRYPVKSMAGEPVRALRVDGRGAAGDRTYAVWQDGRQVTAREAPRLLAWRATYPVPGEDLEPAEPPAADLVAPDGARLRSDDAGLALRLSADLGREVVVRRDERGQQDLGDSLLLTTRASLDALAGELPAPLDLRRFRTNLHLDLDAPAWAELAWEGGRVELEGGVVLSLLHPCERCAIPTRDPDTQVKWGGLLRHLAREHETCFGINARVESPGRIEAGERVAVHGP